MNKDLQKLVDWLTNTSVDDMKSGLYNYGVDDLAVLRAGQKRCTRRGEKTKAKVLASHIRKLEKEQQQPVKVTIKAEAIELTMEVED